MRERERISKPWCVERKERENYEIRRTIGPCFVFFFKKNVFHGFPEYWGCTDIEKRKETQMQLSTAKELDEYAALIATATKNFGVVSLARLGSGSESSTYVPVHVPMVLKVYKEKSAFDAELTASNAMNALLEPFCPYVVRCYASGVIGTQHVIAMEHVAQSTKSAGNFFVHLVEALQFVHRAGVRHNEFHVGNILITTACEPKVVGFGTSEVCGHEELVYRKQQGNGAPLNSSDASSWWWSPERRFNGKWSGKDDVWALGACILELFKLKDVVLPNTYKDPVSMIEAFRTTANKLTHEGLRLLALKCFQTETERPEAKVLP